MYLLEEKSLQAMPTKTGSWYLLEFFLLSGWGNPYTIATILNCDGSIWSLKEKLRDLWEAKDREPGIEYGFHVKAERFFFLKRPNQSFTLKSGVSTKIIHDNDNLISTFAPLVHSISQASILWIPNTNTDQIIGWIHNTGMISTTCSGVIK